jgi:hypothetical protein
MLRTTAHLHSDDLILGHLRELGFEGQRSRVQALLQHRQHQLRADRGAGVVAGYVEQEHLQVLQRHTTLLQPRLGGLECVLDAIEKVAVVLLAVQLLADVLLEMLPARRKGREKARKKHESEPHTKHH